MLIGSLMPDLQGILLLLHTDVEDILSKDGQIILMWHSFLPVLSSYCMLLYGYTHLSRAH